ncbi:MAG: chorismate synthase, partial [Acidobacteriota bacterium]
YGVEIVAWVQQIHRVIAGPLEPSTVTRDQVEESPVRCPDPPSSEKMVAAIEQARRDRDSVGGVIAVVARNCPAGWGEPVFDKLEALLGHAYLSIPASKGVEIGSGFGSTTLRGSEHNDEFVFEDGQIRTRTNHSGGIQGGISNGMPILARVAFKPTATINKAQGTVSAAGEAVTLAAKGRHDPCVLPRAVPIVEAMTALVLIDLALQDRGQMGHREHSLEPRHSGKQD